MHRPLLVLLALFLTGGVLSLAWVLQEAPAGPEPGSNQAVPPSARAAGAPATAPGEAVVGGAAGAGEQDPAPLDPQSTPTAAPEPPPAGIGPEWHQRNAAGIAALSRGDAAVAVGLFEACVEAHPEEPVFARNLAIALEALAREGRQSDRLEAREEALELLARAIELYPETDEEASDVRASLQRRLDRWRQAHDDEAEFFDDGHLHFQLSYDGTRQELRDAAPWILERLEQAYLEFGEAYGRFPVEEGRGRIRVVLQARDQFGAATGLGDWAGGAFDGTVRIPVEGKLNDGARRRLLETLRHELAHAFARSVAGVGVPGWLNEGLAQRLELESPGRQALALKVAEGRLRGGKLFPLAQLEGNLGAWQDPEDIARAYAQSLGFVAYIEGQYGQREVLEMVLGCRNEESPQATFQRRLGLDLDTVLGDYRETLR